jgi:HEAT repeat protein
MKRISVAAVLAVSLPLATSAAAFVWPNVPEQLARALASGDVSERRVAASRLAELPSEIGIKLASIALADPDVDVRLRAAQAAISLHVPKAGDAVMPWLTEGDPRLRLAACEVIRAAPTDRSVIALGRVLGDPDAHVRFAAAAAMGASGMAEAVSPLLGHLDDQSPEVRSEVARALGRIGDAHAVVPLVGKVQDSVSDVRRAVAHALGELGDPRAANALMLALQDASQEVRTEAVTALGRLKSDEATLSIATLLDPAQEGENPFAGYYQPGRRPDANGGQSEVRSAALRALGRIGSEQAVKVLLGALAKEDASASRSTVRDALVTAGKPAVPQLVTVLSGSPNTASATGAALVLGALGAKEGAAAIERAMQRGVLPTRAGLHALADIGANSSLPTVLERLDDADPAVRKDAIRAAASLLEPGKIDGRPVDPAAASLKDSATPLDEKIALTQLLGKTGAPRAQAILLPLASAKSTPLRIAALDALGMLGVPSADVDKALLSALRDDAADVRFSAAMALGRVGRSEIGGDLLERLTHLAEQDRGAIGIALAGVMARSTDDALAAHVAKEVAIAPDSARDALIEGLGRMKGEAAGRALEGLVAREASPSADDRRKVAEAFAGHAENVTALRRLAEDADPSVRASAVWSLGASKDKSVAELLAGKISDPDVAVAGNAAASLGRLAAGLSDPTLAQKPLCGALTESRSFVRANAIEALSIANAVCEPSTARDLLSRDTSEAVRLAAADYLARAITRAGDKAVEADKRSLLRCASEDRNARVAGRCGKPLATPNGTDDIAIYIVPDGHSAPEPRAPFSLVLPDGLLRMGVSDRRGEVFERSAPRGSIRLDVPGALAR